MADHTHEWFESWFDTEYYHILYKNRDHNEAQFFIDNLCKKLNVRNGSKVMDLACGKGRHSIYLAKKGCDVTGVDLSQNSIKEAQAHENEHLRFWVRDMRENLGREEYDVIFNLFTSFGYFGEVQDNLKVLQAIKEALKPQGYLVLDYFNAVKALKSLPKKESKEIDGIQFDIRKSLSNGKIIKQILVNDMGHTEEYYEKVSAFTIESFKDMLDKVGLKPLAIYGDYALNEYNEDTDRLILFVQKA